MDINKNNCEAFFLDYHEGNLTPQQVADLFLFIAQHPEFKEEFENFENLTLEDFSSVKFENKSSLKKEITTDNKEEYFIRSVENTLNTDEIELLNIFLKQHPQFLAEFKLFQKTKLSNDTSIVFENKNELKKSISVTKLNPSEKDEMLISAIEGQLTNEDTTLFNQQLLVDAQIKKEYALYQKTKSAADTSIVYENKEELKHQYKKAIPFYYYFAAAASIALLVGLFFLFNTNEIKPKLASIESGVKNKEIKSGENAVSIEKKTEKNSVPSNGLSALVVKKKKLKNKITSREESIRLVLNEATTVSISNEKENNKSLIIKKDSLSAGPNIIEQPIINSMVVTQDEKKNEKVKPTEFVLRRELAVEKIKEKLLDKNTIAAQKKSQRWKKITGWDIAQIITRGISKFTGRKVEIKPYYNDEGAVTAYAVSAGRFQLSKGR